MSIALFYITSCLVTYLSAIYFGKILVADIKANGHEPKYLEKSKNPNEDSMRWIFKISIAPIVNLIVASIIIRITYSYHQYTMGRTDYNILKTLKRREKSDT